ncbi:MAG: polysaccharide biosynthesis C-terminal domain-containing protein, partial [Clostridia bacterium]|nr:polysaccharide biosynthesis C-terminal domain-containing protein [Clostridia bacterium]
VMFDLMAGFLMLITCLVPVLFKILVRGDYADSYAQIPILLVAEFFFAMATFIGGIYVGFKATKNVGITTVLAAACNLLADLLLIKKIGLYAASVSTLISYIVLFVFRLADVQKIVPVRYNIGHMLCVLGLVVLSAVLCALRNSAANAVNALLCVCAFCGLNRKLIMACVNALKGRMRRAAENK